MYIFFQFILVFIIYFIIIPLAYYVTEVKQLPVWLQWKPWTCRLCLSFWSLLFSYVILGLSFGMMYFMITGIILSIFTAIAMHIDQKEKTVKIEDFDKFDEYSGYETVDCDEILVNDNGFEVVKK